MLPVKLWHANICKKAISQMLKYEKCIRINVILYFCSHLKPPIPSPYLHFQLPISLRKWKHSEKDILILPPPNLYAYLPL